MIRKLVLVAGFAAVLPFGLLACGDDNVNTRNEQTQAAQDALSAVAGVKGAASGSATAVSSAVKSTATVVASAVQGTATQAASNAAFDVNLKSVQGSGVAGQAHFAPGGDQSTKIDITLSGGNPSATYSAGLYEGTCDNLDDTAKYPLQDVTGGKSSSTVQDDIAHLTVEDYALVITQGGAGAATPVACGGVNP